MISIDYIYFNKLKEKILKAHKDKNDNKLFAHCLEMNHFLNVIIDRCLFDYDYFKYLAENI